MTHFHPQRLKPRYVRALGSMSRLPGGLPLATRLLAPLAFDHSTSFSENPSAQNLKDAEIIVCGFPRTGTTFLQAAIAEAYRRESACWKNHDVLAISTYLRRGIPTIVTVRHPLSTAISWSIYNRDTPSIRMMADRLDTYSLWHENVLPHLESRLLRLKPFDQFKSQPLETLSPLLQALAVRDDITYFDADQVTRAVRRNNADLALSEEHANVPSAVRGSIQAKYRAVTESPEVGPHLNRATKIYETLLAEGAGRPVPQIADLSEVTNSHRGIPVIAISTAIASTAAGLAMLIGE